MDNSGSASIEVLRFVFTNKLVPDPVPVEQILRTVDDGVD